MGEYLFAPTISGTTIYTVSIKEKEIEQAVLKVPNLVIKHIFYDYSRNNYEEKFESYLVTDELYELYELSELYELYEL